MQSVELKAGSFVWACAFRYNTSKESMALRQEPIYGMLAADITKGAHDAAMNRQFCPRPRYFIPCKKNSVTELAWSRAVKVEARNYAASKEDAVRLYNEQVRTAIGWHQNAISELKSMLLQEGDSA